MKTRKNIARLLSFLMVLSLLLGISAAPVYSVGGEGETASFETRESNGQTGTVQYKLDGSGDFISANNSTLVALNGATSITIKAIPNGDAQVNQSTSWISGTEEAVTFDYGALISESGWTYNIQDNDGNIIFTIEFDNHDGTGGGGGEGGKDTYTVYFGEGSWEIGGVTVTADKTDVQYLAYNDIITLENFDPETMEVRVEAEDGFRTTLAVTDGQTSISAHTNDVPYGATLTFAVVEKSSNPGENVYYIDLGTGSWTVGDVTVSAPEGMSGVVSVLDTETIPTEMLANFDPETMDITLTVSDGFVIYLEIDENGNTTLASTRDGVELPPYGEILTFAVVTKPGNMEIVDKTEENACNADLAELTDDLISKLLTDAEKTRLENGEEVKVRLEVTDISASVSQTDKDLIDSKKGNATIGMYLDIDLLKQIGSDSPVNITETNGAVTITLKVPSSLINSNSSVTRTYQMIRVHNGVATVIPCTYNAANQTISCEADQFSTYALAYVDQQNNSGGGNTGGGSADGGNTGSENTGSGSTGNGSNDNAKDVVPKTGDASIAYIWFILALVSGIGALYFGKKGLASKKGN